MRDLVLSLYDFTGVALQPWVNAGYGGIAFDIQHNGASCDHYQNGGFMVKAKLDLYSPETMQDIAAEYAGRVAFVLGFPPCTDLAVSGAAHFAKKRAKDPAFQDKAAGHCKAIADLAAKLNCPFMIENPVSVLSTLWRKPDHTFHPYQFGGYIQDQDAIHPQWPDHIPPRDAYSKKTCLWTGGGFVMPARMPVACESFGASRQHRKLGGKSLKTKNIRSATPRGFAQAVFEANEPAIKFAQAYDEIQKENHKQENCECGLDEKGQWSEIVFDRYGCDCDRNEKRITKAFQQAAE